MPQQQQPNHSLLPIDMRTGFNIWIFIVDAWCAGLWPFTRCHMGTRGMGTAGFWAMLFIPIYAGLAEAPDLLAYWHLWLAMAIYRRITADPVQDTRFQGFVWMFNWCTKSEMTARLLEAASMPLIGGILSTFSEDIGRFLTLAIFPLSFRYLVDALTIAKREEAVANAIHDMNAMQVHFQRARRDH
jgi:hypothetical protein